MKAWTARDANGCLFIYFSIDDIFKDTKRWKTFVSPCLPITDADLPEGINPQWSDVEPIEVELKIERAKQ